MSKCCGLPTKTCMVWGHQKIFGNARKMIDPQKVKCSHQPTDDKPPGTPWRRTGYCCPVPPWCPVLAIPKLKKPDDAMWDVYPSDLFSLMLIHTQLRNGPQKTKKLTFIILVDIYFSISLGSAISKSRCTSWSIHQFQSMIIPNTRMKINGYTYRKNDKNWQSTTHFKRSFVPSVQEGGFNW